MIGYREAEQRLRLVESPKEAERAALRPHRPKPIFSRPPHRAPGGGHKVTQHRLWFVVTAERHEHLGHASLTPESCWIVRALEFDPLL